MHFSFHLHFSRTLSSSHSPLSVKTLILPLTLPSTLPLPLPSISVDSPSTYRWWHQNYPSLRMMKEAPKTLALPRRRLPQREKPLNAAAGLLVPSLLPDPILWVVCAAVGLAGKGGQSWRNIQTLRHHHPPPPTRITLDLGVPSPSVPALPVPAAPPSPDRYDPKKWRRLLDYFYRYRILPSWATVGGGFEAAGSSEAAPCTAMQMG